MQYLHYRICDTLLLGPVTAAGDSHGLITIILGSEPVKELHSFTDRISPHSLLRYSTTYAEDFFSQLTRYLCGELTTFDYPYRLLMKGFTRKVLEVLPSIPYGQVRSYHAVAALAGSPHAARAVGQACRCNPLPLLIPCHRVTASHGIGGFSPGLDYKRKLLSLEKAELPT